MKTKAVAYAYATSPNADKFRLKDGGFVVEVIEVSPVRKPPVAVAGFTTIEEAKEHAHTLPYAWDRYTMAKV